jgi:hypothetical protein
MAWPKKSVRPDFWVAYELRDRSPHNFMISLLIMDCGKHRPWAALPDGHVGFHGSKGEDLADKYPSGMPN